VGYAHKSDGLVGRGFEGVIRRGFQRKSGDFSAAEESKMRRSLSLLPAFGLMCIRK